MSGAGPKDGADKVLSNGRETRPFVLAVSNGNGTIRRDRARAVIDASGTWTNPNPLGAGGILAEGEVEHAQHIAYGIPDVLGRDGRRVLVVGGRQSAANVLLDLARLAKRGPRTSIVWAMRGANLMRGMEVAQTISFARGELGLKLNAVVESGGVTLVSGFPAIRVRPSGRQVVVDGETADGAREIGRLTGLSSGPGSGPT